MLHMPIITMRAALVEWQVRKSELPEPLLWTHFFQDLMEANIYPWPFFSMKSTFSKAISL